MKLLSKVMATFLIVLLIMSQVSVVNYSSFYSAMPNLILILVFALFMVEDYKSALLSAFFGGLVYDILTIRLVGLLSIYLLVILLLFYAVRKLLSHSIGLFLFMFYLISVFDIYLSQGFVFKWIFLINAIFYLLILFLFVGITKFLLSFFNPPAVKQLRFKNLQ